MNKPHKGKEIVIKFIRLTIYSSIVVLIGCLLINCSDSSTRPDDEEFMDYFPFGHNYTWTYEKISNSNISIDSILYGATFDTVTFSLTVLDTIDGKMRYLFSREKDYDDILFLSNDTIFSAEYYPPFADGPCIIWKNDFQLNEKWNSWLYTGTIDYKPQMYLEVNNEITNLDTVLSVNNFKRRNCMVVEKFYVSLITSSLEKWYFAKGIGLIRIEGTKDDGDKIYRYDLLDFGLKKKCTCIID